MAILATVVARAMGSKRAKPSDFMPNFDQGDQPQDSGQMLASFRQFVTRNNAAVEARKRRQGKV